MWCSIAHVIVADTKPFMCVCFPLAPCVDEESEFSLPEQPEGNCRTSSGERAPGLFKSGVATMAACEALCVTTAGCNAVGWAESGKFCNVYGPASMTAAHTNDEWGQLGWSIGSPSSGWSGGGARSSTSSASTRTASACAATPPRMAARSTASRRGSRCSTCSTKVTTTMCPCTRPPPRQRAGAQSAGDEIHVRSNSSSSRERRPPVGMGRKAGGARGK